MKNWILLMILAAGIGLSAFGGYYAWRSPSAPEGMAGELEWLQKEFDLNAEQFARVEELHAEYQPICDVMCERVIQAQESLDRTLMTAPSYTVEIEQELARFSRV